MNLQINDDNSPGYIGWQFADGSLRITVGSAADHVDDDPTLFTYSPMVGVEAGMSKIVSLDGRPSILVFRGPYDDQRKCFDAWAVLARENSRTAIFRREGMAALVRLHPVPAPPLPQIDQEATAHANEVLKVSRMLLEEAEVRFELSEADCHDIVMAVAQTIEDRRD